VNDTETLLPVGRFLHTLEIVRRKGRHLAFSRRRLFGEPISAEWVEGLEQHPELAERLEAFVSRFGRMQDTVADKLLPRWLQALAETPGTQIENLNRAERLGVVESTEQWLAARKLRNRMVHEYMDDPAAFASALLMADGFSGMLFGTYARVRAFAHQRMGIEPTALPPELQDAH